MDYSYERIELRDRLLDMKPMPPPYTDSLNNYRIDSDPSPPVPQTSDYGHKDTTPTNPDAGDCNDILHMGMISSTHGQCSEDKPGQPPPPHKTPGQPSPAPTPAPEPGPGGDPLPDPDPVDPIPGQGYPHTPDQTVSIPGPADVFGGAVDYAMDVGIADDILEAIISNDPGKIIDGIQNSVETIGNTVKVIKHKCIIM